MPLPYTQGQVNAAVQRLQPMVTVQAPQTNVAVPATTTQGQVVSANVDPMYREAQIANPNYNMPGSAEAYSRWGIPPVMVQSDPYGTIAWQANGDGTVTPLMAFGSRYPHVVNGVPRQVGSAALGNLLGGLMNMANRFVPPLPVVRRSGGGGGTAGTVSPAKPAAPVQGQPVQQRQPMRGDPYEHSSGKDYFTRDAETPVQLLSAPASQPILQPAPQLQPGIFALPRPAVDSVVEPYNNIPSTPAPAQPSNVHPADTAAVMETLALARQLQQVMGLA